MKKLILLLTLLTYSSWGICQINTRSNVKAGLTYVLFGRGDMDGVNYYNEYNHKINRYLTFAPSVHFASGSSDQQYLRFTKSSFAFDPNIFVSPMRFDKHKIRLGVGPSLRYMSDPAPFEYEVIFLREANNFPPEIKYILTPLVYDRPLNYWTIGYSVVLEAELNLDARWNTGIRASFQNYTRGETVANIGLNVGYRF